MKRLITVFALMLAAAIGSAQAAGTGEFDKDVGEAYAGYRVATSYLRTGNSGLASLELAGALDHWSGAVIKYAKAPPPPYAGDATFAATLTGIEKTFEKALAQAENGDAQNALNTLEPVRGKIYDLRKRNGVRLYADCVTELNRAMEPLYKHRHAPPDFGNSSVRDQVTEESKTYESLLKDCRAMASAAYTGDPEFVSLFGGTLNSIQSMYPAIDSGDPVRVINVLRELRSFDRIIFFRFGG